VQLGNVGLGDRRQLAGFPAGQVAIELPLIFVPRPLVQLGAFQVGVE
jgi:hypothetical protein